MPKITKAQKEMNEIIDIEDHLEVVYTAFCIQCAKQKDSNNEMTSFSEELHKLGWRVSGTGDMHCPDCAKIAKP